MNYRQFGMAGLLLGMALAGCGSGADTPEAPATQKTLAANPDMPEGIRVAEGAWLSLPAVPGNPGALYFSVVNGSDSDAKIAAVDVSGAGSAMLHRTETTGGIASMADMEELVVPAGQTVSLRPGETHVMVSDVDPSLAAGDETEATLIFETGDKASFPVLIRGPGDQG